VAFWYRGGKTLNEVINELTNLVDSRKKELINLVKTLISYQTPAPPARNTKEAQRFIASFLRDIGFEIDMWDVYPNDPNIVGVLKGSHPDNHHSLIINGHIDVAEVNEDEPWEKNPFTPIVQENVIIGRGAADMKGGLACALFAV
jgi:formylaminopyrimidine deformylase